MKFWITLAIGAALCLSITGCGGRGGTTVELSDEQQDAITRNQQLMFGLGQDQAQTSEGTKSQAPAEK